jgi:ATP-dependent DNA helicase RecG
MSLPEILERLEKPLRLETRQGFQDRAASGGLEAYVLSWQEKAVQEGFKHFGRIVPLFKDYSRLNPDQRQKIVNQALDILKATPKLTVADSSLPPGVFRLPVPPQALPRPKTEGRGQKTEKPPPKITLETEVKYLPGIGPKRGAALRTLGVTAVGQLLHYYPRAWQDRSRFTPIARLEPGRQATVKGLVRGAVNFRTRGRMLLTEVAVQDESGVVFVIYFNQPFRQKQFTAGQSVVLSGKAEWRGRQMQLLNPEAEVLPEGEEQLIHTGRVVPLYPLAKDLTQRPLRSALWNCLSLAKGLPEYLPGSLRKDLGLMGLAEALPQLHFPESFASLERAKRRLVFDELFLISLGLALRKAGREALPGISFKTDGALPRGLLRDLPFRLTGAQERVWDEIQADLRRDRPMHRLVQGDVGSGKTLLAALALAAACDNGLQGALMAPTEILAEQHLRTLKRLFEPLGIEVLRLLQGQRGPERREVLRHLQAGHPLVAVGTQALIQEGVEFGRLGLAVVDEQHRFGVMQRLQLSKKAQQKPHVLVMTATPIPRTLAMTLYGDLDVSVVDEMPPGRKPVLTRWLKPGERKEAYEAIRSEIRRGRQAYVVYALVEESEKAEWKAATQMAAHLQKEVFPEYTVGLLHGQMKPEEKDAAMTLFQKGSTQILVSTTVIEVGVDVPNATLMMVEDADRFGLSQLHQLRGRVGRGSAASFCYLVGAPSGEEGRRRLEVMEETNNGFLVAEEDLRLRGPGEFLGLRQSGLPDLKLADLLKDQEILIEAKKQAEKLISTDPKLGEPEHAQLLKAVTERFAEKLELGEVG